MFWTETSIGGKIKGKYSYQLDYQYRRSADAENVDGGNHDNLFKNPFQQVIRPWIHYQYNDIARFSLSPIGWWGTWSNNSDNLFFQPEFRIIPQVILAQKIGRIGISHRYRYEFRFQGDKKSVADGWDASKGYYHFGDDMHTRGRFRYLFRTLTPLNHISIQPQTFYLDIYNEIFLNAGSSVKNTNLLDQNRLYFGLGYRFKADIRLTVGYLKHNAFRFNNTQQNNVEANDVLQIFLFFDNFNKIFKKKPAEPESK